MPELDYDVLVVGGGVTGVAAATAAARGEGGRWHSRILKLFVVGGNATTGLCLHNYITKDGRQVAFGMAQEIVDRLMEMGGAGGATSRFTASSVQSLPWTESSSGFHRTEILDEAGVTVLYGVNVVGVEAHDGYVEGVRCAVKGGVRTIRARTYVPRLKLADADVAVFAWANRGKGERATGKMQPISMLLRCYGTDNKRIAEEIAVSEPAMATRPDHPVPFPVYFNGSFSKWNDVRLEEGKSPSKDDKVFFNTVFCRLMST